MALASLSCSSVAKPVFRAELAQKLWPLKPVLQDKLYGLFQRLHDHVGGFGIGLYSVKRIVEDAGGAIAVQSAAGVGSVFTATLPHPATTTRGAESEV